MALSIRFAGSLVIASLLFSCQGTSQTRSPFREYSFAVDSTQLADLTTYRGISFRLPRDWTVAGEEIIASIREASGRDSSDFRIEPVLAVYDSVGSVFVVSGFRESREASSDFAAFARLYGAHYRKSRAGQNAAEEWLLLGDLPTVQFYSSDSARVQFTYLVSGEAPVHIGISVLRDMWASRVHTVESMLGTMRRAQ